MSACSASRMAAIQKDFTRSDLPDFRPGDTVKVHARIVEGTKERVQIFQGVVVKRHRGIHATATFTVRKVSYNIGVERTFFLHSPRIEKIEVLSRGEVRRARLYYLRDLRGKSARIKSRFADALGLSPEAVVDAPVPAAEAAATEESKA